MNHQEKVTLDSSKIKNIKAIIHFLLSVEKIDSYKIKTLNHHHIFLGSIPRIASMQLSLLYSDTSIDEFVSMFSANSITNFYTNCPMCNEIVHYIIKSDKKIIEEKNLHIKKEA